jgi:putative redox protein
MDKSNETIVMPSGLGKFAQQIIIGSHELTADEPVEYGGNDLGPSPYDLLLAALGACTSMTLQIYAQSRQIPLEKVVVRLTHEKTYAKDCEDCENKDSKIDHIERKIELQGKLSEEQRNKLLDIANHCPVHRTLTSKILITTLLI